MRVLKSPMEWAASGKKEKCDLEEKKSLSSSWRTVSILPCGKTKRTGPIWSF
jgi:hypothetical protein